MSSLSRRIVGSLALAAVTSTTALAAAPAQAITGPVATAVSMSSDPVTYVPADLSGDSSDALFTATGTAPGWVQDIEFWDGSGWSQTYLPVSGVGVYYGSLDQGGYVLQFEAEPDFESHSVKYRVMFDGVWSQAGIYTVTAGGATAELIEVTPGTPTQTDDHGTANDAVLIPNTAGVLYSINGQPVGAGRQPATGTVTVTAAAQPGYQLTGTTEWTLELTDAAAPPAAPKAVVSQQGYNTYHNVLERVHSGSYYYQTMLVDPATQAATNWVMVPGVGQFDVHNDGDYAHFGFWPAPEFSGTHVMKYRIRVGDQWAESTWTVTTGEPATTSVAVTAPSQVDDWGSDWDTYKIPSVEGVRYLVDGEVKAAGTYPATGDVTVTAEAEKWHVLTGETSFVFTFDTHGAADIGSTGVGTDEQSSSPQLPDGAAVALLDGDQRVDSLQTEAGTFAWDAEQGRFTFTPKLGFSGTAAAPFVVSYRDRDFRVEYTATVEKPAGPVASPWATSGPTGHGQQVAVDVPTGGSLALLDGKGAHTLTRAVTGQGTYRVVENRIEFTPIASFYGKAQAARFVVVDAYGQTAEASYAATVVGTPEATLSVAARTVHATQVRALCDISVVNAKSCTVAAYATVDGTKVKVGTGKTLPKGTGHRIAIQVKLTKAGKQLAARPQGVNLTLEATIHGSDKKLHKSVTRTHLVAPVVSLRPIYFDADSAALSRADKAYLASLRTQLKDAKAVTITGYADARAPKSYNTELGKARAEAVRKALTGLGGDVKVTVASKGEKNPVASNRTRDGRAQNRRVEVRLKF